MYNYIYTYIYMYIYISTSYDPVLRLWSPPNGLGTPPSPSWPPANQSQTMPGTNLILPGYTCCACYAAV